MERRDMSTRDTILDAAESVFVSRGFSGASMKSIAERVEVAKSLLYHYFPSKKELWKEVIHRRVEQAGLQEKLIDTVSSVVDEGPDAARERGKHTTYFQFMMENPQFVRMLAWLNAEQAFPLEPPLKMREEVLTRLESLQASGVLRDDIDPRMFVVCFMALCETWFTSMGRISAWLGEDMKTPEKSREYMDAAGRILLDGMKVRR